MTNQSDLEKQLAKDFEIWWKQQWSFAEKPTAETVYSILRKANFNARKRLAAVEKEIQEYKDALEWLSHSKLELRSDNRVGVQGLREALEAYEAYKQSTKDKE